MYARILVPIDGSRCSDHAVADAVQLARALAAEVTVLYVLDPLCVMSDGVINVGRFEAIEAQGRTAVSRAEGTAREAGVVARGEVVEGSPAREIVRRARGFDLVVMRSHGKGQVRRLLLGSVLQAVLPRIERPVVVVTCGERHGPP